MVEDGLMVEEGGSMLEDITLVERNTLNSMVESSMVEVEGSLFIGVMVMIELVVVEEDGLMVEEGSMRGSELEECSKRMLVE